MIVKNEMANLPRCLASLADSLSCWVICDTGSTDGTQEFIKAFFRTRGLPGELCSRPFVNFEQARNAALDCAYASNLEYDYLLFCDADMELVVENPRFREGLQAPAYSVLQVDGVSYWNTRLVRRDAGARYRGVTHEFVEVADPQIQLSGIWYRDHASGSNRIDKFERDIRLLSEALKTDPDNARHQFYLAQSLRDAGQTANAAEAYLKRAQMGGWEEEGWYARLQHARTLKQLGDEAGFVKQALEAFNQRPHRAEPLYDLARHYREKGMNDASAMFSEPAMEMRKPDGDVLFLEDFVYDFGLREEFSIAANYSPFPDRKSRGFDACDALALSRAAPAPTRSLAAANLHFYLERADRLMPSWISRPVGFAPPDGYAPTNPSLACHDGEIFLVQRAVNYRLDTSKPDGDDARYTTADGSAFRTRNFLVRLDADLAIAAAQEILEPADMPEPAWTEVRGFEDIRLFSWRGELHGVACVRELSAQAWCEMVLARIDPRDPEGARLVDWRVLRPEGPQTHEKNWMPCVESDRLRFVYSCDPARIVDEAARPISQTTPDMACGLFRGGSQLIPFDDGWLALVHETHLHDGQRHYRHRFVGFDASLRLRSVSRPFFFQTRGVEFAAGLAWRPDGRQLLVSYGVEDREAWLGAVDAEDVRRALRARGG